ncbi:EutN/CcmL family microcompartment protein [Candidatus Hydrogenedentota bacterium]
MVICRVIGTVTASVKHESFEGRKMMLVQPYKTPPDEDPASPFLAMDFVQAGVGDLVLVLKEGGSSNILYGPGRWPVHAAIAGIIDEVQMEA